MANVNDKLMSLAIRAQIDNGRFANNLVREIVGLLNDANEDLVAQLIKRHMKVKEGAWTSARLQSLVDALTAMVAESGKAVYEAIQPPLADFAAHEAQGTAQLLQKAVPVKLDVITPNIEQLKILVGNAPIQGALLGELWEQMDAKAALRVAQQVRLGITEGEGIATIVRRLTGSARDYEAGIFAIVRRECETLVRTSVNHVSNQAIQQTYAANKDIVKNWTFLSTMDGRTSVTCRSLSGSVWPIGEGPLPPRHPNCLPGDSLVSPTGAIAAVSKRWFDGNLIVFKTASGKVFSCTPNHPVLTSSGWVAASLLNVGGNVISDGGGERGRLGNGDDKQVPARIEDIAEAFLNRSEVLARPVPVSPEDFHHDGMGSEVAVIYADRELWISHDASFGEHDHKLQLVARNHFSAGLRTPFQYCCSLLNTPDSIVRRLGKGASLFWSHTGHACKLLLASISGIYPISFKNAAHERRRTSQDISNTFQSNASIEQLNRGSNIDGRSVVVGVNPIGSEDSVYGCAPAAIPLGYFGCGRAAGVFFDNNISGWRSGPLAQRCPARFEYFIHACLCAAKLIGNVARVTTRQVKANDFSSAGHQPHLPLLGLRADMDSALPQSTGDSVVGDAVLASYISSGQAGPILVDEIVDIQIREFHGHVYNLQTESNWYVAQGVVSHNCRSFATPNLKTWKELGIDLDELPPSLRASKNGPVRADLTMDEWMREQSKGEVRDMLGATRAKLFWEGTPVTSFADNKGIVYSISDLKERQAAAFARAFP